MAFPWFTSSKPAPLSEKRDPADDAAGDARQAAMRARLLPGQASPRTGSPADDDGSVAWQELARHLGDEVASALHAAAGQLDRLNQLEPTLVRSIAPIAEAVQRARQAALATQHVMRLHDNPPPQQRELINLADMARAVLMARQEMLATQGVAVRPALAGARIHADASLSYTLLDELLLWASGIAKDIALTVDSSSRSGRARLKITAWCQPRQLAESAWHGTRWYLWHQVVRAMGARTRLEVQPDHIKVTVAFASVSNAQLGTREDHAPPSSVSAAVQGCRVLVIAHAPELRAQAVHALAGYGALLQTADNLTQAEREIAQHLPDAVVYDDSALTDAEAAWLRERLLKQSGTPAAFIAIHSGESEADFRASTVGAVSTGHVSAAAISQSLGPALVFELCKVM
ncbi:MAG: hypothetical protein Q4D74_08825 [Comamonadaceae bacterium]|nr:hypothetical protein [Comamonadaceae bacterium]RRD57029.1 hypothetical protein EII20_08535 [Comamonadaceae bacterium OH2545_COT-014]